jgi:regulator of sigma E protease
MPAILLYPLSFLLVLGVMIVVHEWGHYAAAKLLGVRVEVFSVGFGPRLVGFRRGDTDYRISAIPLGGYVKMSGENPMEEATGDPAEFMSHPRWHRFIIAIAGPFMNIALAIGLLTGLYTFHFERAAVADSPALVGWVSDDGPAAKAGFRAGDLISNVEGIANPNWEQVSEKEALSPDQRLQMTVQRGSQTLNLAVVPEPTGPNRVGTTGLQPDEPVEVTGLPKDKPAVRAGLKVGDVITGVDGVPLHAVAALLQHLQDVQGKPVELAVLRNGQNMKFTVQPVLDHVGREKKPLYRMGIASMRIKVLRLPLPDAWNAALEDNRKSSLLLLELLQKLVRGKVSIKQVSGPIGIGEAAGDAVEEGLQDNSWFGLLGLMAAISLNLGIFNLLPIPIMDGGVILLLLIEGLMRRDISLVVKERIYQTAFVFLVLFASVVIFNDVTKLPWFG